MDLLEQDHRARKLEADARNRLKTNPGDASLEKRLGEIEDIRSAIVMVMGNPIPAQVANIESRLKVLEDHPMAVGGHTESNTMNENKEMDAFLARSASVKKDIASLNALARRLRDETVDRLKKAPKRRRLVARRSEINNLLAILQANASILADAGEPEVGEIEEDLKATRERLEALERDENAVGKHAHLLGPRD